MTVNKKQVVQRQCKQCNSLFTPKRSTALYCDDKCKNLYNRNKNAKNKKLSKTKGSALTRSYSKNKIAKDSLVAIIQVRPCVCCGKPLLPANRKYCNRVCQKTHTDSNKLNNYHRSGFLKWWLEAFKRSWCLGVLHNPDSTKQTATDIAGLYEAYKTRNLANGSGELKENIYNLCHLDPNIGKGGKHGLLHWSNFLVAPKIENEKLGNEEYHFNLSAFSVANKMQPNSFTDKQLIHILDNYLDGQVLEFLRLKPHLVARKSKIKPKDIPPSPLSSVLFREIPRLGIDWTNIYEGEDVTFTIPNPIQTYRDILTNNLT